MTGVHPPPEHLVPRPAVANRHDESRAPRSVGARWSRVRGSQGRGWTRRRVWSIETALAQAYGTTARWEEHMCATGLGLGGGNGWSILKFELETGALRTFWSGNHTRALAASVPLLAMDMYEHSYQLDFGAAVPQGARADRDRRGRRRGRPRSPGVRHASREPAMMLRTRKPEAAERLLRRRDETEEHIQQHDARDVGAGSSR
jgi:hypothetical protein